MTSPRHWLDRPANAAKLPVKRGNPTLRTVFRQVIRSVYDVPIGRACVTFNALGDAGRLGNQLFQIAAVVEHARKLGVPCVFPPWESSSSFARPLPTHRFYDRPRRRHQRHVRRYAQPEFCYNEITAKAPVSLFGYFQSERFFDGSADRVRAMFEPAPGIIDILRARYEHLLARRPWSLHVRRGDYVNNPFFADLSSSSYYHDALQLVPEDRLVIVFSDDPDWARERFVGPRFYFAAETVAEHDLFLMGLCAGNIIANSSFSWWGAWLGDRPGKPIIAPRAWFAGDRIDPTVPFSVAGPSGFCDTRDLIPARWRRV